MDFGDVMILVIGIFSCVISIAVKKEKDAKKTAKTTGAGTYQTPVELSVPKQKDSVLAPEEEGVPTIHERVTISHRPSSPVDTVQTEDLEEIAPKEKIDKKKLLVYSEIMKTKF